MNKKTLKIVDRISKKYRIHYTYTYTDKLMCKYYGFNNFYAEFIDVELVIDSNCIKLYFSPEITFFNIHKIQKLNNIEAKLVNDRIVYYICKNYKENIKEELINMYSIIFSKDTLRHYFNLILSDSKNKR